MGYVGTVFSADDFASENLRNDQVRIGFILNLPFRIRVTGLVKIPPADATSEVWIHNSIAIPTNSSLAAIMSALATQPGGLTYRSLWSQAVILLTKPKLEEGVLEDLKKG